MDDLCYKSCLLLVFMLKHIILMFICTGPAVVLYLQGIDCGAVILQYVIQYQTPGSLGSNRTRITCTG